MTDGSVDDHWREGYYNVRKGAAGYAQIIGTFAALAVTAIALLLTGKIDPNLQAYAVMAGGLLVVAMLGSLVGAIGMAAIGSETEDTGNLGAAMLFMGAAVSVSLINVLGAFQVLAVMYLHPAATLLAWITATTGIIGIYFASFTITDGLHLGPKGSDRKEWLARQWVQNEAQAKQQSRWVTWCGSGPTLIGLALHLSRAHRFSSAWSSVVIFLGLAIAAVCILRATSRMVHPAPVAGQKRFSDAVTRREAFTAPLLVGVYNFFLLTVLP